MGEKGVKCHEDASKPMGGGGDHGAGPASIRASDRGRQYQHEPERAGVVRVYRGLRRHASVRPRLEFWWNWESYRLVLHAGLPELQYQPLLQSVAGKFQF